MVRDATTSHRPSDASTRTCATRSATSAKAQGVDDKLVPSAETRIQLKGAKRRGRRGRASAG